MDSGPLWGGGGSCEDAPAHLGLHFCESDCAWSPFLLCTVPPACEKVQPSHKSDIK